MPGQCLCFTGHRRLNRPEQRLILEQLPVQLRISYDQGIRVFLAGGALGFDTLASECVLDFRKTHPDCRLIMALPCISQSERWLPADIRRYDHLKAEADEVILVSEAYFPGCMQKRNRFLVDHAQTCICYMTHCRGGTWNTVSYAYDMKRTIINLAAWR